MKPRIIFLDFDGVLNSVRTCAAEERSIRTTHVQMDVTMGRTVDSGFDPIAVKLLWNVLMKTDSYIVVSSSWRYNLNLAAIRTIFSSQFGWPSGAEQRIIGVTGRSEKGRRGTDIQNWIDDHTVGIRNFRYIIIDDSGDMLDHQFPRLVQTDGYEGFLYRDYKKCLNLFDKDDEDFE